jgi:hypothetical protein
MSARRAPSTTEWVEWCEAEALVSGWLSVRPYAKPNNRAGAPEMLLAREGVNIAVWVRPGDSPLTQAQTEWARAMVNDEPPTSANPVVRVGSLNDGDAVCVIAVLVHPSAADRDTVRELLQ